MSLKIKNEVKLDCRERYCKHGPRFHPIKTLSLEVSCHIYFNYAVSALLEEIILVFEFDITTLNWQCTLEKRIHKHELSSEILNLFPNLEKNCHQRLF
jgi:hypothetical protein